MTAIDRDAATATSRALRTQEDVEAYVRAICFKTGPPDRVGAELEWTVHHTADPSAPLQADDLRRALGRYTPATLDPPDPPIPLPSGAPLTAEPGGQLEISSLPAGTTAELHETVSADLTFLTDLLDDAGLSLGEHGIDPHRPPRRLLSTPRYAAMERAFDARGPHGRTMMCSTAGLQVCLDAGTGDQVAARWAAVNALGPPLIALFANSRRQAGRDSGWASARMAAWWGIDPRVSGPPGAPTDDPATTWARHALAAPLLCVRRDGDCWDPPPGLTLRDWAAGALPRRPTTADVDYHLSTLFPPVRPRGYLEVRYLDAQPGADWIVAVAVVTALLDDPRTTDKVLDLAAPTADRWVVASRRGLADPGIHRAATAIADLACRHLDTGLPPPVRAHVIDTVQRRLHGARQSEEQW
ncbi:ergothioneine biosynthesis glutamate--cysteine ligase EgtA [Micromonosporaceae bacterium Da 78-11]